MAYRRQKIAEADSAHDWTRVFNERFTAIATQLGDAQAAMRLAGVHAMAGLADDWQDHRQTLVGVLCDGAGAAAARRRRCGHRHPRRRHDQRRHLLGRAWDTLPIGPHAQISLSILATSAAVVKIQSAH